MAGDIIGQGGIEAVHDKVLRGKDGMRRVIVDIKVFQRPSLKGSSPSKDRI